MILELRNIAKHFSVQRGLFKRQVGITCALENISFSVNGFQTLAIAGESGSGKTTLAKIILKLISPTSGEIIFNPQIIKNFRKDVQIIFQNPYNSLNPKMKIKDIICEPLEIHKLVPKNERVFKAAELLKMVNIEGSALERYPIEFSGGQRQRICIARALASQPKLLVLDEPISSLDLTIQSEILDLFLNLKQELRLTYIFISHNLAVVKYIADRIIIMRNGRIVELGDSEKIFAHPQDTYTKLLLEATRG